MIVPYRAKNVDNVDLYPAVSLLEPGDAVKFNFTGPFLYSIPNFENTSWQKEEIPSLLSHTITEMISNYLESNGYIHTLNALEGDPMLPAVQHTPIASPT